MSSPVELRRIEGRDGYYAGSDGGVYSSLRWRGSSALRRLRPCNNSDGYPAVTLHPRRKGERSLTPVHRLIAVAFHGAPTLGMEVRHLDGDRWNSRPENLCWGSRKENADDKARHGTGVRGESVTQSKLTAAQVKSIRARRMGGAKLREIAEEFGVSLPAVGLITTRRNWAWLK